MSIKKTVIFSITFAGLFLGLFQRGFLLNIVAQETEKSMVLLHFTSDQCPACQKVEPLFAELTRKNYPIVRVNAMDSQSRDLFDRYGISTTPSYVMLLDGEEINRYIGRGEGVEELKLRILGMFEQGVREIKTRNLVNEQKSQNSIGNLSNAIAADITQGSDRIRRDVVQTAGSISRDVALATKSASDSITTSAQNVTQAATSTIQNGINTIGLLTGNSTPIPIPPAPDTIATENNTTLAPVANPQGNLLTCSVRLRAGNQYQSDCGTGTIIHTNSANGKTEGLVLTCGHLFRDSGGKGPVNVDLFDENGKLVRTVTGECILFDDDLDIGFVGIPLPQQVKVAQLIPQGYPIQKGDQLVSVGCTGGEDPTVWDHQVLSIDQKYHQTQNRNPADLSFYYIEVNNAPRQGRSGGGLFIKNNNGEYYLIGVCNAGDPQTNEGYFLPPSVIYRQLQSNRGLAFVYNDLMRAQNSNAATQPQPPAPLNRQEDFSSSDLSGMIPGAPMTPIVFSPENSSSESEMNELSKISASPAHYEGAPLSNHIQPAGGLTPMQNGNDPFVASLEELRRMHEQGAEIICIVNWGNKKNGNKTNRESEVIRLNPQQ